MIVVNAKDQLDALLVIPEGTDNVSVNANILYGSSTRLQSRINNLLTLLTGNFVSQFRRYSCARFETMQIIPRQSFVIYLLLFVIILFSC